MIKIYSLIKKILGIVLPAFIIIQLFATSCYPGIIRDRLEERLQQRIREKRAEAGPGQACDGALPGIDKGYGAEGRYDMEIKTLDNPLWKAKQISVLFPIGADGKRPVIFFSHGFGATDWDYSYPLFMRHMVSRGYIVVYSPYQMLSFSAEEKYAMLWKGFELAVENFGGRMDLSRVGFAGHSFGGGATPAMAYKGIVNKGWGSKAGFMFILAPWYSFEITPEEMKKFPEHLVLVVQVYDKDEVNDFRMAIDIFRNIRLPEKQKHFMMVRSTTIDGCEMVADHVVPARNPAIRLKQYGLYRPFDALADYVFDGNPEGNEVIQGRGVLLEKGDFQPIVVENDPQPGRAENSFKFQWGSDKNPRRNAVHD